MNNRLFLSVAAAALIAGAGLSHAQGPAGGGSSGGAAGGGAGAAQQSAPSGGGAAGGGMSGGAASERGAPSGGAMNRGDAAEPRGGAAKQSTQSTQSSETSPSAKGDAKGGMNKNADTKDGAKDMNKNADTKNGADKDMNRNAQGKDGAKDGDKSGTTTGQAAAGGKQLTTEQRTKVTTVIKQQNVQPITNINFSISVGTRVPRDVRFNPLPAEIITVYPDWRGYEFFLARGEIIVVNPRTLEIVAVLPA